MRAIRDKAPSSIRRLIEQARGQQALSARPADFEALVMQVIRDLGSWPLGPSDGSTPSPA